MKFEITDEEAKKAKFPHELFLINLITNHILLFVGLLGMMKTYPVLTMVTPAISMVVISYLMIRNSTIQKGATSWFIRCHWQVCIRRSKVFLSILIVFAVIIMGLIISVGGDVKDLKPGHYAIAGVTILPTMLTILTLIITESDAMHQAKTGVLPKWVVAKNPNPEARLIEE